MIDPSPLWHFEDPVGSEHRFRAAADAAGSEREQAVYLTQLARALGLQEQYDEGHAVLDALDDSRPEVLVRIALERGRLLRSSGKPAQARPHFEEAARVSLEGGLDALHVDALHMVALVAEPADQLDRNYVALAFAKASKDPAARNWDASLLNNIGMARADSGDFGAALAAFEEALFARERIGDPHRTRVARWMVAWALRNLGMSEVALEMQRELKAELDAAGEVDPYVDEELALLSDGA
jgi:tetratricopeptide (TPR) repeat protein